MKNIFKISSKILFLILFASCFSKNKTNDRYSKESTNKEQTTEYNTDGKSRYKLKTYLRTDNLKGWGYDVYKDNALLIHQPHIPVISGEVCFKTEEEAIKVGSLTIHKLEQNIIPPMLTLAELDSLKINKGGY